MILEYLAPGARRRTHTAGTTEASLLGLLDVENHILRVQKGAFEVNCYLATVSDSVKRHLPIEYAADLTPVVAAKEARASGNARGRAETA